MISLWWILATVLAMAEISPQQFTDRERKLVLNVSDTHWDFFAPEDFSSHTITGDLELKFVARSPDISKRQFQPTLTLRIDKGQWRSAREYADHWLKDYPKFGYELQDSRDARYGILDGYDIELLSIASNRRVRQFIVQRPQEILVFTCSADGRDYRSVWQACERILKTSHQ